MHLSGELRAPDGAYERILRDLALIRAAWPVLQGAVDDPDYVPDELLVELTPAGPWPTFDAMNVYYQVTAVDHLFGDWYVLTFCDNINAPVAAEIYATLADVDFAEPNSLIGTDDEVTIQVLGTTHRYAIDDGFHDCFDGCDCFRFWVVDVTEAGAVSLADYSESGQSWCVFEQTACCLGGGCQVRPIATCVGHGGVPLAFGSACAGDPDGDAINTSCGDNCPTVWNPAQADADADGPGDLCDNCPATVNADQTDADLDGVGTVCDNCPAASNPGQADLDSDSLGDPCDNCPLEANATQSDLDADAEGDRCDLDDGWIYLVLDAPPFVDWQAETGYDAWNLYRGSLAVLLAEGVYTQAPGSNPLAAAVCGLPLPGASDAVVPAPGQAALFLATGTNAMGESGLGEDSAGRPRPHDNPCP